MKPKTFDSQTLQQLLDSEASKTKGLRSSSNESYLEHLFHNLDHLSGDLLSLLLQISKQVFMGQYRTLFKLMPLTDFLGIIEVTLHQLFHSVNVSLKSEMKKQKSK